MYHYSRVVLIVSLLTFGFRTVQGQTDTLRFWDIPEKRHAGRFWLAAGSGVTAYGFTLAALNQLWYSEYGRTSFHLYDDSREWMQMDKAGHMFTSYFEADWLHHVARWTGMSESSSIWTGVISAMVLQATIEVLDGFALDWGFSPYDIVANTAGCALWAVQQATWKDQRVRMKVSSSFRTYPEHLVLGSPGGAMTLRERSADLFGEHIFQTYLKDYNAQTIWLSVNVHSFLQKDSRFPKWLNLAIGYGAENMYGGYKNQWTRDGNAYWLDADIARRYRQFYVAPDIDLSRIGVKSRPLKALLHMVNIFKLPTPALEINGKGIIRWHWLHI
jgi:hypothetical protein